MTQDEINYFLDNKPNFHTQIQEYANLLVEVADHITWVDSNYDESIKGWNIELGLKCTSRADTTIMIGYGMKEDEVIDFIKNEIKHYTKIKSK